MRQLVHALLILALVLPANHAAAKDANLPSALDDITLPADERVEVAVRWLRATTIAAQQATVKDRPQAWRRLAQGMAQIERQLGKTTKYPLVLAQYGMAAVAQAEQLARIPAAAAKRGQQIEAVRQSLRVAIGAYRETEKRLAAQMPTAPRTAREARKGREAHRNSRGEVGQRLTIAEIENLQRNVELRRATAYRLQAMTYPADSVDWKNSLRLAMELAGKQVPKERKLTKDAITVAARAELAECRRVLAEQIGSQEEVAGLAGAGAGTGAKPRTGAKPAAKPASGVESQRSLAELRKVASARPQDGQAQEALAMRLGDEQATYREAYRQWLKVEHGSRAGTARWQRARAARIDLLTKLGKQEKAQQLRRITELLEAK